MEPGGRILEGVDFSVEYPGYGIADQDWTLDRPSSNGHLGRKARLKWRLLLKKKIIISSEMKFKTQERDSKSSSFRVTSSLFERQ